MAENKLLSVALLAEKTGAKVVGDPNLQVRSVNDLMNAGPDELTFITHEKYTGDLENSSAGAILTAAELENISQVQLVVDSVEKALITVLEIFAPSESSFEGIHEKAVIEKSAVIEEGVSIGPFSYIGHNVKIGKNTSVSASCTIEDGCTIGSNCRIDSHVAISHRSRIGNFCIIQSNTTIGSTGFGYFAIDNQPKLVPHNGSVIIEDGVEIGANCCVDRAKFGYTVIGAGTKLDNMIQIAHNVQIGKCCLIAAQCAFAGSSRIGNGVIMGGQSTISDHYTVGDGTMIGGKTGIADHIPPGQRVLGVPAIDARIELKYMRAKSRLPDLIKKVRELNKKVRELESQSGKD